MAKVCEIQVSWPQVQDCFAFSSNYDIKFLLEHGLLILDKFGVWQSGPNNLD